MGNIPLNVICHFPLVVVFNILSLSLIFISLITMCFNVFLLGLSILGSLCFLDLVDYFLSHVREVFSYYLFNIFSGPLLLSSSSGTPIMQMLVRLILSQRSLSLSSFFFTLFSTFCSAAVISTILSSRLGFLSGSDCKESACNAGYLGSIPGL